MQTIIIQTANWVQHQLKDDASGHDYEHILRVYTTAKRLAKNYPEINLFELELIALLHDIGDYKLHKGIDKTDELVGNYLQTLNLSNTAINKILTGIHEISFSKNTTKPTTLEAQIVQDADRLDAIGAIGIARTFAFGGKNNYPMWVSDSSQKEKIKISTRQHFEDKLLHLLPLMNTEEAKKIAISRDAFMRKFLKQLEKEQYLTTL